MARFLRRRQSGAETQAIGSVAGRVICFIIVAFWLISFSLEFCLTVLCFQISEQCQFAMAIGNVNSCKSVSPNIEHENSKNEITHIETDGESIEYGKKQGGEDKKISLRPNFSWAYRPTGVNTPRSSAWTTEVTKLTYTYNTSSTPYGGSGWF